MCVLRTGSPILHDEQIPFNRSAVAAGTGGSFDEPRQQINVLSAFIDAANVCGVDSEKLVFLREHQGGRMRVDESPKGDLLPRNTEGFANAGGSQKADFFLAGDVRGNEHVVLASLHTLFVRVHRERCEILATRNADLELLGLDPFDDEVRYHSYGPARKPDIANEFSERFLVVLDPRLAGSSAIR